MCFTQIYNDLLKFSSTVKHRDALIYQVKLGAHQILERIENCLLVPLSLYEEKSSAYVPAFNDKTKLNSAFSELKTYCNYLAMVVRVYHIYQSHGEFGGQLNQSDSIIEKSIKLILSHVLKVTQMQPNEATQVLENIHNKGSGSNLGVFLWQHTVFELLYSILCSYSRGIQENIKKNIDNLLVPDDVFTIGKSIVMNLIEFKPIVYRRPQEGENGELNELLIDNNLQPRRVQNVIKFNNWAIIGELLKLFSFDQ